LKVFFAVLALAVTAVIALEVGAGRTRARPRPNVLILVMDTTRADRCSFLGYSRRTTPHLEEFARDAVAFLDAWSPACWTGPAHASLFTGLRPEHHLYNDTNRLYLGTEFPTLAERLTESGYASACFSSNGLLLAQYGLPRGFETVKVLTADAEHNASRAADTHGAAAEWAEAAAKSGKPFLLFVNDMEPHLPYSLAPNEAARFLPADASPDDVEFARGLDFRRTTAYMVGAEEVSARRMGVISDMYDAEIAVLDSEIGFFFDRLRADGLLDSTIVVVAGDHGEMLGDGHMIEHGASLRRAARHVPLLVRFPDAFDGGRTVASVVRLEDVMPTVLELCRLPPQAGIDGASLTGDLEDRIARGMRGTNEARCSWLRSEFPGVDVERFCTGVRDVYDGRWHYLLSGDGREELFDVPEDPSELTNLAARDAETCRRMRALLGL
jgi:arylsulfatase A-like enzyme